jgi:hypothetical protein
MRFTGAETHFGPSITCRDVVANWTLTNPSGGEAGIGELTSLTASGCSATYRPRLCTGASAEVVGLPQRAPLRGKRPPEVKLEGVSMSARCSTGETDVGGPLEVSTRRGVMHPGEGGECEAEPPYCHPAAAAYGRLTLARNITAK